MKRLLALLLFVSAPSWGAIGTTPLQCLSDQSASRSTLDVDITTTAGNLLIATAAVYNQNQNGGVYTISLDAALTEEYEMSAGGGFRAGGAAGWKVAAGGLESFTADIGVDVGQWRFEVCEYASTGPGTPEVYASNPNNTNENTLTQSAPSGTASDTSAGVAFYLFHLNNTGQQWQAGRSYTNGTESVAPANENRPVTAIATETIDGSSTSRSSIFSITDTGGRNVGGIMLAREVGGAGPVEFDQDTYNPGNTITATATAFTNPMTTATELAGGDVLNAEPGATNTLAQFILCPATGFETGGQCNNTQIGKLLTYQVTDGTSNATDTLTIQVPAKDSFGQIDCDPYAPLPAGCDGDSLFRSLPPGYEAGDEYWCDVVTGLANCTDGGVPELGSIPATIRLRVFDVSLGVWGDSIEFDLVPESGECPQDVMKQPNSSPISSPVSQPVCP